MAKTLVGLNLEASTAEDLRALAGRVNAGIGDLADLFIRRGISGANEDALRTWAASKASTRGRLGGGLRKDERAVLEALRALVAEGEGWTFPHLVIAAKAKIRPIVAFEALGSLQGRKLVLERPAESRALNRFGRPIVTLWAPLPRPEIVAPPAGGDGALGAIRTEIAGWISAGADDATLWATVEAVRPHLAALRAKLPDGATALQIGLAERDLVRATGLRIAEVESGI